MIAELVAGEIGRALGLPVPEIVFVELDAALGRNEPDFEIKALLDASVGLNLGLDFLPASIAYDPADRRPGARPDAALASRIVWFDAYVSNVDRTARNTNMLLWHNQLYLIDHGAALYFHHAWRDPDPRAPAPKLAQHVLLPLATELADADRDLSARITPDLLHDVLAHVPDDWLGDVPRRAYVDYLLRRLGPPRDWWHL